MPKIQPEDKTSFTELKIKLRADVAAKIEAYGHYLSPNNPSSGAHVIAESFNLLIARRQGLCELLGCSSRGIYQGRAGAVFAKAWPAIYQESSRLNHVYDCKHYVYGRKPGFWGQPRKWRLFFKFTFVYAKASERPSERGGLSLVFSVFLLGAFWAPMPPPTGCFGSMETRRKRIPLASNFATKDRTE